jgi:hypothetical protein
LSFGPHTLHAKALDRAGNTSRATVYRFDVLGRWDAAAEFARPPSQQNPGPDRYGNTTWFYFFSRTRDHDPSQYQLMPSFDAPDPNFQIWHSVPGTFDYTGAWLGWSFGRLTIAPGTPNLGQNAIVGWRSPVTASIKIAALVWHNQTTCADISGNGITWSIDQGASTLRRGTAGPGETNTADVSTTVATGDAIFLVIGDNGDSYCDGAFVNLTVETTPAP